MFYVYKNTQETSVIVAKFEDQDQALAYMETKAMNCCDPDVIGYCVRDFDLKLICEYEV
jgi:hypothetical protein